VHVQGLDSAAQADLFRRLLSAGICFHGYQQLSYMILSRVTPVTHSIGNCVKRVVVIVASVIAFQNPMSTQNAMGEHAAAFAAANVAAYPCLLERCRPSCPCALMSLGSVQMPLEGVQFPCPVAFRWQGHC
jgi:hypothetical protein